MSIQLLIQQFKDTLYGEPWFGQSVYALLDQVNERYAYEQPNNNSHSLVELVYHMYTWADFTLGRIRQEKIADMGAFEKLDWRKIDQNTHSWNEGLAKFKAVNNELLALLDTKDDNWLKEKVEYREYDFAYLLNGLIQHNIYHAGQVAYVKKLLE